MRAARIYYYRHAKFWSNSNFGQLYLNVRVAVLVVFKPGSDPTQFYIEEVVVSKNCRESSHRSGLLTISMKIK